MHIAYTNTENKNQFNCNFINRNVSKHYLFSLLTYKLQQEKRLDCVHIYIPRFDRAKFFTGAKKVYEKRSIDLTPGCILIRFLE